MSASGYGRMARARSDIRGASTGLRNAKAELSTARGEVVQARIDEVEALIKRITDDLNFFRAEDRRKAAAEVTT